MFTEFAHLINEASGHGRRAKGQFFFHTKHLLEQWQKKTAAKSVALTSDSTPPKRWNIVRNGSRYTFWNNVQCYVFRIWLPLSQCRENDTDGHKKSPHVRKWTNTVCPVGVEV